MTTIKNLFNKHKLLILPLLLAIVLVACGDSGFGKPSVIKRLESYNDGKDPNVLIEKQYGTELTELMEGSGARDSEMLKQASKKKTILIFYREDTEITDELLDHFDMLVEQRRELYQIESEEKGEEIPTLDVITMNLDKEEPGELLRNHTTNNLFGNYSEIKEPLKLAFVSEIRPSPAKNYPLHAHYNTYENYTFEKYNVKQHLFNFVFKGRTETYHDHFQQ